MSAASPNFEQFKQIVCETLGPVLDRYGFELPIIESHPPEISMYYKREDMRITVFYEYADAPWIKIDRRGSTGSWRAKSLDSIAKSRKYKIPIKRPAFGEIDIESMRTLLLAYADFLAKELSSS